MIWAIVSASSGYKVRTDVAMTGEITLRGRVLPIGGLKEKTVAAFKTDMKTVIIPEDNLSDLEEIDPKVKKALNFIPASKIDTVIENAIIFPDKEMNLNKYTKKNKNYLKDDCENIVIPDDVINSNTNTSQQV